MKQNKIIKLLYQIRNHFKCLFSVTYKAILFYRLETINFHSGLGDSAWLLYGLVRSMKPKVCVEIGSARGKSACFIGMALKDNGFGKLYAIDPHCKTAWNDFDSVDTYPIMKRNLQYLQIENQVYIIRDYSENVARWWNLPIDLLFIDGDHSYEGVKKDFELFHRFVSPFGLIIFHDTLWDLMPNHPSYRSDMGVPQFVEELRKQGYPIITLNKDYGVSIVQPVKGGISLLRNQKRNS